MWVRRVVVTLIIVGAVAAAPTVAYSACDPGWTVAATFPRGFAVGAVAVVPGSSQAWAVGHYLDPVAGKQPVALHFDGHRWSSVTVPLPSGATQGLLLGVAALSASD